MNTPTPLTTETVVTRLRKWAADTGYCAPSAEEAAWLREAADENERLQCALNTALGQTRYLMKDQVAKHAEIERLEARLALKTEQVTQIEAALGVPEKHATIGFAIEVLKEKARV